MEQIKYIPGDLVSVYVGVEKYIVKVIGIKPKMKYSYIKSSSQMEKFNMLIKIILFQFLLLQKYQTITSGKG